MKTLAKFVIVAVAAVSTQAMAGSDPFAAMEPAGHSQHGNMSKDPMKRFSWDDGDKEVEDKGVEAGVAVKSQQEAAEPVYEASPTPKAQATETPVQNTSATKSEKKAPVAAAHVNKAKAKPEAEAIAAAQQEKAKVKNNTAAAKKEGFFDSFTFKRGVDDSIFQDSARKHETSEASL